MNLLPLSMDCHYNITMSSIILFKTQVKCGAGSKTQGFLNTKLKKNNVFHCEYIWKDFSSRFEFNEFQILYLYFNTDMLSTNMFTSFHKS